MDFLRLNYPQQVTWNCSIYFRYILGQDKDNNLYSTIYTLGDTLEFCYFFKRRPSLTFNLLEYTVLLC